MSLLLSTSGGPSGGPCPRPGPRVWRPPRRGRRPGRGRPGLGPARAASHQEARPHGLPPRPVGGRGGLTDRRLLAHGVLGVSVSAGRQRRRGGPAGAGPQGHHRQGGRPAGRRGGQGGRGPRWRGGRSPRPRQPGQQGRWGAGPREQDEVLPVRRLRRHVPRHHAAQHRGRRPHRAACGSGGSFGGGGGRGAGGPRGGLRRARHRSDGARARRGRACLRWRRRGSVLLPAAARGGSRKVVAGWGPRRRWLVASDAASLEAGRSGERGVAREGALARVGAARCGGRRQAGEC